MPRKPRVREERAPSPSDQFAGEQEPGPQGPPSRAPPPPGNTVCFQRPHGPPQPQHPVQGRGQGGWGGSCVRKNNACPRQWLFQPWASGRQGRGRRTGGRSSAEGGRRGRGRDRDRMGRGCRERGRGPGARASEQMQQWARGLGTVAESKEEQQSVERDRHSPPALKHRRGRASRDLPRGE